MEAKTVGQTPRMSAKVRGLSGNDVGQSKWLSDKFNKGGKLDDMSQKFSRYGYKLLSDLVTGFCGQVQVFLNVSSCQTIRTLYYVHFVN